MSNILIAYFQEQEKIILVVRSDRFPLEIQKNLCRAVKRESGC